MKEKRSTAEFVVTPNGVVIVILPTGTDKERKKLSALNGLKGSLKSVEHYGGETWLSFTRLKGGK